MPFTQINYALHSQTWALAASAAGEAVVSPVGLGVASVQVTGSFGGATVVLEVSNDGTNWVTLTDRTGAEISLTAAGFRDITSGAQYVRARAVGGSGTSVTVRLVAWGN